MSGQNIISIGGQSFRPGEKGGVELPIGSLIDYQAVTMSVHVRRSRKEGPTLLLTAGIHGDELIGVEILRRLVKSRRLQSLRGTLIVVPVVNMPAFLSRSRYLPDRRDLNRLFPGSPDGSLGGRLAATFVDEIVSASDYAIDFHAGAVARPNLPQIRISPGDEKGLEMAKAFKPPVIMETGLRDGSLRSTFVKNGIPSLLYEASEAYRLDPASVRYGLRGVFSVMQHLEMLPPSRVQKEPKSRTMVASGTTWVRAPQGGLLTSLVDLGKGVNPGTKLGHVGDPFGRHETPVVSDVEGVVIGINREATADEGDALFHIATFRNPERAEAHILRSEEILEEHTDPLT
ncbi:MAG: succinylglutamate desuccinylase [Verrucomicrobiales bacterium]|nr:succinylglutamate desuccinylase [Verrucomicrobiales bacterium]